MTWENFISTLKDVGAVVGILVTLFGVLTGIFKPLRQRFIAWVRKIVNTDQQQTAQSEDIKQIKTQFESLESVVRDWVNEQREHGAAVDRKLDELSEQYMQIQCGSYYTLGNVIREVYHENHDSRRLSEHDLDLCKKVYALYHDGWHQNGPIEAMWQEMQSWEITFN